MKSTTTTPTSSAEKVRGLEITHLQRFLLAKHLALEKAENVDQLRARRDLFEAIDGKRWEFRAPSVGLAQADLDAVETVHLSRAQLHTARSLAKEIATSEGAIYGWALLDLHDAIDRALEGRGST